MESAKSTMAVALADERLGQGWRRSQTRIRVIAVLSALVAALIVFSLFQRFRVQPAPSAPQRELVASVDLRIGNPAGAAERGEARAKADIEAGLLQLQGFGTPPARAREVKQRYGVGWVARGREATPVNQAYVDAYNRVVQAEFERRRGRDTLDRLVQDSGVPLAPKKDGGA